MGIINFPFKGNDVKFNEQGTRIIDRITITQYQRKDSGMYESAKQFYMSLIHSCCLNVHQGSNGKLLRLEVGEVLLNGTNATFHEFSKSFHFPGEKCWGSVWMSKDMLAYNIPQTINNPHIILLYYYRGNSK